MDHLKFIVPSGIHRVDKVPDSLISFSLICRDQNWKSSIVMVPISRDPTPSFVRPITKSFKLDGKAESALESKIYHNIMNFDNGTCVPL